MANVYGVNYQKEWRNEPSQKAAKGVRNAAIKANYEEFTGVASADVLYICKFHTNVKFLGLEGVTGTIGAGAVKVISPDGSEVTLAKGDTINGQVEGGVDLVLVADGTTSAALKVLAKFLAD